MNSTTTPVDHEARGACPATGRSASVCLDPTHAACYAGRRESDALDRKVEQQQRRIDPSY